MIINWLTESSKTIFLKLEKFSNTRFWIGKAAIILTVLCVFFAFPKYTTYHNPSSHTVQRMRVVLENQISNPLIVLPDYGDGHEGKMQYRLAMPLLAHFLHLNLTGLILFQHILGIFFFAILIMLILRCTDDKVAALLTALGFCFIYVSASFFTDLAASFDGVAYFCLASTMVIRNPFLVFMFIFFACWIDERALIASSLVLIWWQVNKNGVDLTFGKFFKFGLQSVAILLAWALYFLIRYILTVNYGFHVQTGGLFLGVIKATWPSFLFGLLTGIEWYWLFIIFGLIILLKCRNYFLFILLGFATIIISITSIMVYDETRSLSYLFPAIFIFIYFFYKRGETIINMRYILLMIALLCFLLPNFCIYGSLPYMQSPIFMELLKNKF